MLYAYILITASSHRINMYFNNTLLHTNIFSYATNMYAIYRISTYEQRSNIIYIKRKCLNKIYIYVFTTL